MLKYMILIASSFFSMRAGFAAINTMAQISQKENDIELVAECAYLNTSRDRPKSPLDGRLYIRNVSQNTVFVVAGSALGPIISPKNVRYILLTSTTESGYPIKPTPGSLDITELLPGQMVALQPLVLAGKKEKDGEISIIYEVESGLQKFYPQIWVGRITITIGELKKGAPH